MIQSEFLFSEPHCALGPKIGEVLAACRHAHFVTGFATPDGVQILSSAISAAPSKVKLFLVGAGTQRGFDAIEDLRASGVHEDALQVHLGYSRPTKDGAKYPFIRYHPMLHAKLFYFELPDEQAALFVGSCNVTNFALNGLNGEAAVLLKGDRHEHVFEDARQFIHACAADATRYDATLRDAYAWWTRQFIDGLAVKVVDRKRDYENKQTLVVFCTGGPLVPGDILYLELPTELYQNRLSGDVHIYPLASVPRRPLDALNMTAVATEVFEAKFEGLENRGGGLELRAKWHIPAMPPALVRTQSPFKPRCPPRMQQARVRVNRQLRGRYLYHMDRIASGWTPHFDMRVSRQVAEPEAAELEALSIVPEEHHAWFRVAALHPRVESASEVEEARIGLQTRYLFASVRRTRL